MNQGTGHYGRRTVGRPTDETDATPYAALVARSAAFVRLAARHGHVAFAAPGRPHPAGLVAVACACESAEYMTQYAPWRRAWEQWTWHAYRAVAAALGHGPDVRPAGKMDAPDMVRVECACGYTTGPGSETSASQDWRAHADAMLRREGML